MYVELNNKAAVLNGFRDTAELWMEPYETDNFDKQMEKLWQTILPYYEKLHAYIRRKLFNKFGEKVINLQGPIPAHLLGDLWAQNFRGIYDIAEPYSQANPLPDATPGMIAQGWNETDMFQAGGDFFTDMGLMPLPEEFWSGSVITYPT